MALAPRVAPTRLRGGALRPAVLAALNPFTRLATGGLILVLATWIDSALNCCTTPADLVTSYGGALILKVILVALLVAVGAAHHQERLPDPDDLEQSTLASAGVGSVHLLFQLVKLVGKGL